MWSNLRVDDNRWNSLIIPKWIQVFSIQDHYVQVDKIKMRRRRITFIPTGGIPAQSFIEAVNRAASQPGWVVTVSGDYLGQRFSIERVGASSPTLRRLLDDFADKGVGTTPGSTMVNVERAFATLHDDYRRRHQDRLEPALFSASRFRKLILEAAQQGWSMDISYTFLREHYEFRDAIANETFRGFVSSLEQSNFFQGKLDLSAPQRCQH